ncbi:NUDIX hydrolase [Candidatus Nanosalina sp. VS9-1]|uniref:NUDIX hydrolase n=1 Tax=Candidatus Nanosalina sp. VS9-1 TaxID=3388566 RepID=UPI0039E121BF
MSDFHAVAANLIEKNGEYLLVQEGKEAVRGEWNLPAGGVDKDESIQDAAVREAREETGLEVELENFMGVFVDDSDRSDSTVLVFVFHSRPQDFSVERPKGEEILDVKFFTPEEFSDIDVRIPFLDEAVKKFERGDLRPLDTVVDCREDLDQ